MPSLPATLADELLAVVSVLHNRHPFALRTRDEAFVNIVEDVDWLAGGRRSLHGSG